MAGHHTNIIRNRHKEKEIIIQINTDDVQLRNAPEIRVVNLIHGVDSIKTSWLKSGF